MGKGSTVYAETPEGVKFIATEENVYFPVNCPWPSAESDKIKNEAIKQYDAFCLQRKPVYLVMSSYWACEGFWIEFEHPGEVLAGGIMRKHE